MTKALSCLIAQAILIQMVFSQNSNINPSTSASSGKGPLTGPVNTNSLISPVSSNNKGLFAGAVGSSFNKGPALGPINSISGPINSNLLGPVGSNNKVPFAGALGTSGFGFGAATYGPSQYAPGPYGPNQYGPVAPFTSTGSGNVAVNGELPVAGNTGVFGQVPVTGTVQFNGKVPASGAVTITGICSCGAPGFHGF